jgi:SP family arabinose:H+ symporter-like MFS transporter
MKSTVNLPYILAISMVSAMGGLLFGYDWVVIGGAKPFYERYFDIISSPNLQGWAMSSALIGCLAGAGLSGWITDKFGRKNPLIFAAALFVISAIGTGSAQSFTWFMILRAVGGIGIGLASNLSPMYIAEISPANIRGKLVSLNQLTIVIGIFAAQLINWKIADPVAANSTNLDILKSWNGQMGWRWMFWAAGYPAGLFFILMFFVPESPRWLANAGKHAEAMKILTRLSGKENADKGLSAIQETLKLDTDKISYRQLFSKRLGKIMVLGIVLAVFQQWCGINVVFNYAEEVFSAAGYGVSDILFNILLTGIVNLIFTFVAISTVDKWGRKSLMLFGSAGLAFIYILMAIAYFMHIKGIILLILVVIAIAVYAMSLAPVTWVILSEIFPNKMRGQSMAMATLSLWIGCLVLTYTFPFLNNVLGPSGTFGLYSLICFLGLIFIFKALPETRGKSLEEIEKELTGLK